VAYAGRVRFSHATLTDDGDKGVYDSELPLSILSSPKPTTMLFYLQKASDELWTEEERKSPQMAETIGYDGPNKLRGRKFYRHHGDLLSRQEYERADSLRDKQNRSVRGVRTPDNIFNFTIDFHNLAPVELGALLWVLQLGHGEKEEQCYHRLGYAKPLGFGSVRIDVEEVQLLDINQRYASLDSRSGWKRANPAQRGDWIYHFEQAMHRCYGHSIRELDNIRDLFALLQKPDVSLPKHIHYPRTSKSPDSAGENFKWFVGNKRKSKKIREAGPNHTLDIAAEEEDGLPLL
jgi:CRISPR-associated protein (TIGR03986 family)